MFYCNYFKRSTFLFILWTTILLVLYKVMLINHIVIMIMVLYKQNRLFLTYLLAIRTYNIFKIVNLPTRTVQFYDAATVPNKLKCFNLH